LLGEGWQGDWQMRHLAVAQVVRPSSSVLVLQSKFVRLATRTSKVPTALLSFLQGEP
jgi:hypothetical protein